MEIIISTCLRQFFRNILIYNNCINILIFIFNKIRVSYMLRMIFSLFILVIFSSLPLQAMLPDEKDKSSKVTYSLPKEIDQEALLRSSVLVKCGLAEATGVAIGDKWILTAAHNVVGYVIDKLPLFCAGIVNARESYHVPGMFAYTDNEGYVSYNADFGRSKDFKIIPVVKVHFHPTTRITLSDETPEEKDLSQSMEILLEVLQYGIHSAEKHSSVGVFSSYLVDMGRRKIDCRTYGPDLAILQCEKPHGLPVLPISDEVKEERSLVHILGFGGMRYKNEDKAKPIAGCARLVESKPVVVFQPKIYGQRFRCLPAFDNGLKKWINRPFLRKNKEGNLIMEAEVFPNAPNGFGLIAQGDSGAGCIVMHNGKPALVGVVSAGEIDPIFIVVHNFLEKFDFDESNAVNDSEYRTISELIRLYKKSSLATDQSLRWFVTQTLADVTTVKPWIESVIHEKG